MPRERRLPKRFRSSDDSDQEGGSSSIDHHQKSLATNQPPSPSKKKKKVIKEVASPLPDLVSSLQVLTPKPSIADRSPIISVARQLPNSMNQNTGVNNCPTNNFTNMNSFNQQQSQQPLLTNVAHSGSQGNIPLQPIIINPNDPNAPAIYPCGICHREVHDNDDAILCESSCNFWFHRICTGMTEAAYTLLTAEQSAEWVCDMCIGKKKKVPMTRMKCKW
ncbi:uncharacterized protein LOC102806144 [Saccoglossus kowalevskii]|uniref:Pygopus 1/2-like MW protein n=1 Tax=Saccoglossus kowalevskii TaxID=10224 RepID=A0A1B1JCE8_SACKO|nr:PREDICTED: pygopus homolog 1-like [Saccoglossus kowalevskii]ANS11590.1 pygopus 1/2-like MW protein [Saccoglossus kowalevskii]